MHLYTALQKSWIKLEMRIVRRVLDIVIEAASVAGCVGNVIKIDFQK